jgi:outer membrane lipoprotein-sorting protein
MVRRWFLLCAALFLALGVLAKEPVPPPKAEESGTLEALLDRMNEAQKVLTTLRVSFVQTNHFRMLSKPQVLKGILTLKKPDTALYKYTSPSPLYFLVKDGSLLVYDPKDKKVVIQDIRRHQNRIIRYLGVGQPLEELRQSFDVAWKGQEGNVVHLALTPTKYRMKRKIAALHFWVDGDSATLKSFEVVETEGDSIRFDFTQWEANPTLAEDAFKVDIPPGVKVHRQLTDFEEPFKP